MGTGSRVKVYRFELNSLKQAVIWVKVFADLSTSKSSKYKRKDYESMEIGEDGNYGTPSGNFGLVVEVFC